MGNELNILKEHFIDYMVNVHYTKNAEESLRRERAEIEFNTLLEKIKHPDFKKCGGWEEYIPMWLEKAWPYLNEGAKILLYVTAIKCKDSHGAGWEEAFNKYDNQKGE